MSHEINDTTKDNLLTKYLNLGYSFDEAVEKAKKEWEDKYE